MADSYETHKKCLFQAIKVISGYSSTENSWTDSNVYWETLWILSHLRKGHSWMDSFAGSRIVDIDSCRDV